MLLKDRNALDEFRDLYKNAVDAQKKKILICAGTGCVAGGSLKIYARLIELLKEKGVDCVVSLADEPHDADFHKGSVGVKRSGCHGFCETFLSGQYRDALNYCGSHSGRDEDKFAAAGLTLATRHNIPYVDEGNFVLLCEKMSATRITEDSFLLPEIKEKWYKDGDMHTMYVAEIIDILAR